eukprot:jgi/Botrbrau1/23372/Bobra.0051s0024.1
MRVKTVQVVWHCKEPVFSIDFHPSGLLATGGGDKEVKIWQVKHTLSSGLDVSHVSSVANHQKSVNCIRFSPTGAHLVSAGDGGEIILWRAVTSHGDVKQVEDWKAAAVLRGHTDDVLDLTWAPDASALASASIENVCYIWDMDTNKVKLRLANHHHYVQGVAWDPMSQYIASQSADRTCRIYGLKPPAAGKKKLPPGTLCNVLARDFVCQQVLSKRTVPRDQGAAATGKDGTEKVPWQPLFHDDSLMSFFRRLAWSPDGSFLVTAAGQYKSSTEGPAVSAAHVYARGQWSAPLMALPACKPVVSARFCPVLFKLGSSDDPNMPIALPYKMVFAIATLDSVVLYDTQSSVPLTIFGALHFANITDIAWSSDGSQLAVSSYDGYCSIAVFEEGELGETMKLDEVPPHVAPLITAAAKQLVPKTPQKVERAVPQPLVAKEAELPAKVRRVAPIPVAGSSPRPVQDQSTNPPKRRIVPMTVMEVDTTDGKENCDPPAVEVCKKDLPDMSTVGSGVVDGACEKESITGNLIMPLAAEIQ